MITLCENCGSGSKDYWAAEVRISHEEWGEIRRTAVELLTKRGQKFAAKLLEILNFSVHKGENNFDDEFNILYRKVDVDDYLKFEHYSKSRNHRNAFKQIADTITETGLYIRFIGVDLKKSDEPSPGNDPSLTTDSVSVEATSTPASINRDGMKTFYADDTYAKASKEDQDWSIHLFGGIAVDRENEPAFIDAIRKVKSQYTDKNMPIKWNFKDEKIKEKFKESKREEEYNNMLSKSSEWRLEIFRVVNKFDYQIIVSCIEAFPCNKKKRASLKKEINTYCFVNILERLALDAKKDHKFYQCVLDWPSEGDSHPFDDGYFKLYHDGQMSSSLECYAGPLEKLGFSHSLHFTRCIRSPLMQFTDLVIGATRAHIECKIQDRSYSIGTKAVEIFYSHYRNNNGTIPGYGVVTPTGNKNFLEKIKKIFNKKVNKA